MCLPTADMATRTAVMELTASPSSKDEPIALQTPICGSSQLPGPIASHLVETKQRWNSPQINTYRLAAIFFAFINFGMNDGSYGALVPYVGIQLSSNSCSER